MDSSPYSGYFHVPSGCVGCPCVEVSEGFTPFSLLLAGGAVIDTTPTTPQVTTPQALLVKEEAARLALLLVLSPTSSALSIC